MSKKIENFKVGDEFMVDGLAPNGDFVKTKAKLISYNGMNKYIIDNEGITILVDGDDNAYPIIDDMVFMSIKMAREALKILYYEPNNDIEQKKE